MTASAVLAVRAVLAVVLLVSVSQKVRSAAAVKDFLDWLHTLAAIPRRLVPLVGAAAVAAEAGTLVLLVLPWTGRVGLASAAVLIGFFAIAVGWLVRRGRAVACRCFGVARRPMGAIEIVRNAVLSIAAATAAVVADGGVWAAKTVPAVLLGAVLGLLITRAEDLVHLLIPPARHGEDRSSRAASR